MMLSREEFLEAVADCELGSASGMKPEILSGERLCAAITELVEGFRIMRNAHYEEAYLTDEAFHAIDAILAKYGDNK